MAFRESIGFQEAGLRWGGGEHPGAGQGTQVDENIPRCERKCRVTVREVLRSDGWKH